MSFFTYILLEMRFGVYIELLYYVEENERRTGMKKKSTYTVSGRICTVGAA